MTRITRRGFFRKIFRNFPLKAALAASVAPALLRATPAKSETLAWGKYKFSDGIAPSMEAEATDKIYYYAVHKVDGFTKFASYVGNGKAEGPLIEPPLRQQIEKQSDGTVDVVSIQAGRVVYRVKDIR